MKRSLMSAALGLSLLALPALGSSSAFANSGTHDKACQSDIQQYCSGLKWGQGLGKCLKQNESKLSDSCKDRLAQARDRYKDTKKACKDDVKEYCSNVQRGHGEIYKCLRNNQDKISNSCRDQLGSKLKRTG